MIQVFQTLESLLASLTALEQNEWIYTNVKEWDKNPDLASFYYIPWDYLQELDDDEIYLDDEDLEMPKSLENMKLRGWMVVCDLALFNEKQKELDKTRQWVIEEINYYRDYDAYRCLI
ncbi:hypothetical protein J0A78_01305 [Providencia rettgeri]|uniref:hypothetical protein n=1 Tax=Morganellaceae TaxID=1903414 RepID=UPI0005B455F0|nr:MULTISPECIES: hypothetical protein [Morganellaceae]ELR5188787.1 hypothetical protein [Providencia rettgeri]MBG5985012.1 hypothetical protein [Proteus vulgaris]MBN7840484.1 hypothetical protein [Providencia rettgeri]MBN7852212.1 hypothetical protein [Providencia rettgeri]MBN7860513.1 hypothetical protein [Providencia rettgeri]